MQFCLAGVIDIYFLCPHDKESGGGGGEGDINLPLFVHPDIDTWFVRLTPPTVLELQL